MSKEISQQERGLKQPKHGATPKNINQQIQGTHAELVFKTKTFTALSQAIKN